MGCRTNRNPFGNGRDEPCKSPDRDSESTVGGDKRLRPFKSSRSGIRDERDQPDFVLGFGQAIEPSCQWQRGPEKKVARQFVGRCSARPADFPRQSSSRQFVCHQFIRRFGDKRCPERGTAALQPWAELRFRFFDGVDVLSVAGQ